MDKVTVRRDRTKDDRSGSTPVVQRLAGADRYETMAQVVRSGFAQASSRWAVLATGGGFPDALAASALAGAYGCPVILTVCTGNPLFDLINHFSSHVLAAQQAPEVIEASLGMDAKTAMDMYGITVMAYLGTDDPAAVERHSQAMGLLMLFSTLLFLAKSRDSKNLTPERAQGVLDTVLPQFRAMQPQIVQAVSSFR